MLTSLVHDDEILNMIFLPMCLAHCVWGQQNTAGYGGRPGGSVPPTWWIVIECMLISLVLDGERTEVALWLTGIIH